MVYYIVYDLNGIVFVIVYLIDIILCNIAYTLGGAYRKGFSLVNVFFYVCDRGLLVV